MIEAREAPGPGGGGGVYYSGRRRRRRRRPGRPGGKFIQG